MHWFLGMTPSPLCVYLSVCVSWLLCLGMGMEVRGHSIGIGCLVRLGGKYLALLSFLASPEEMFISKLKSLGIFVLYCIVFYVGCALRAIF